MLYSYDSEQYDSACNPNPTPTDITAIMRCQKSDLPAAADDRARKLSMTQRKQIYGRTDHPVAIRHLTSPVDDVIRQGALALQVSVRRLERFTVIDANVRQVAADPLYRGRRTTR